MDKTCIAAWVQQLQEGIASFGLGALMALSKSKKKHFVGLTGAGTAIKGRPGWGVR